MLTTFRLRPTALLGTPTAGQDFQLFGRQPADVPPAVSEAAKVWLHLLLRSEELRFVTVLHRHESSWWLLCARRKGTDSANRAGVELFLGALDACPTAANMSGLLRGVYSVCEARGEPEQIEAEETASGAAAEGGETARAVLALLGGERASARLGEATAAVLRHAPLATLDWVALLPGKPPRKGIPGGAGLVVGNDPLPYPESYSQLFGPAPQRALELDLPALARLPTSRDRKVLMAAAAFGDKTEIFSSLSVGEATWLAGAPGSRLRAFQSVRRDDPGLQSWLQEALPGLAPNLQELAAVAKNLSEAHRPAIRALLQKRNDLEPVKTYYHLFPQDKASHPDLLPARLRDVWDLLHGKDGGAGAPADKEGAPTGADVGDLWTAVRDTPMRLEKRKELELAGLALAARTGHAEITKEFKDKLTQLGLREPLATHLLTGRPPARPGPNDPAPTLEPDSSWLRGIDTMRLLKACASGFYPSTWRRWWRAAVGLVVRPDPALGEEQFQQALKDRNAELLHALGAPDYAILLVDPDGERLTEPPPEGWDQRLQPLFDGLYAEGLLWGRLRGKLDPWLKELPKILSADNQKAVAKLEEDLKKCRAVAFNDLQDIIHLLPQEVLLGQIGDWGQRVEDPDYRDVMKFLLDQELVKDDDKRNWLRARLLVCGSLNKSPKWGLNELYVLFPVLDPVRDVVREVLDRPKPKDAEKDQETRLLNRVVKALSEPQRPPLPPPPATREQADRRPDWVAKLADLPGWEGFDAETATRPTEGARPPGSPKKSPHKPTR